MLLLAVTPSLCRFVQVDGFVCPVRWYYGKDETCQALNCGSTQLKAQHVVGPPYMFAEL